MIKKKDVGKLCASLRDSMNTESWLAITLSSDENPNINLPWASKQ
jgi:hypothetical protein